MNQSVSQFHVDKTVIKQLHELLLLIYTQMPVEHFPQACSRKLSLINTHTHMHVHAGKNSQVGGSSPVYLTDIDKKI